MERNNMAVESFLVNTISIDDMLEEIVENISTIDEDLAQVVFENQVDSSSIESLLHSLEMYTSRDYILEDDEEDNYYNLIVTFKRVTKEVAIMTVVVELED